LHWFDKLFHSKKGPAHWAKAALVRYADDLVVLARHVGTRIKTFITETLEAWLGLKLNEQKTRVVKLQQKDQRLEFLGYEIGLAPDLKTRQHYYWRLEPSAKALRRELDKLRNMTANQRGNIPLPELIGQLNRQLKGWANAFRYGHPRTTFRKLNWYVRRRLYRLLRRRSQRPWKTPKELTVYQYLTNLGLIYL
jgi:RNA-directed DNA polymerase